MVVVDAFGSETTELAMRATTKLVVQPLGRPIEAGLAYGLVKLEQKLEQRIGQAMTYRFFSKPAYLGLRVGGRAIPYLGWGLLAYDAATLLRDRS